MIFVVGGDSHIWGSELRDCKHSGPNGYSKNTFTYLLGKDMQYICTANPGIGNKEIHDRVMTNLVVGSVVLVCWTWPSRDNELDSDQWIISLQQRLKKFNIPYLFTCVDNCIITNNPKIDYDNWYMFPSGELNKWGRNPGLTLVPRGFYQWATENKYSVGSDGHPLEQAHQDAYNLIKDKFNELVQKNN